MKYIIITPVRDEEEFIKETIQSVIKQNIKPQQWIIINDNSKDNTVKIVQKYMDEYDFIELHNLNNINLERTPGLGVIRAFEYGTQFIKQEYDFIVKLDADLKFLPNYFENIFNEFKKNKNLGIASGLLLEKDGKKVKKNIEEHPYGASKVYSYECFNKISPLEKLKMWDLIDNIKANINGYQTKIIESEVVTHLKKMESAVGKKRENYLKGYYAAYFKYYCIFAILKGIKIMFESPYLVGCIYYFYGYFKNTFFIKDYYKDINIIKYLRKQQKDRLLKLLR